MPAYPPIQIVDENDRPVGGADLFEAYDQGLIFRVVYVVVGDTSGRILLQKRGPTVATYPDCWDVSAAGHVDEGESYETAATRELQEELGFSSFNLEAIETYYDDRPAGTRRLKRFCRLYRVVVLNGTKVTINPEETTEVRWFTRPELTAFIAAHQDKLAGGLQDDIARFRDYENNSH